ncbi:hypothetical protein [Larkinella rosea]|uniref:Uncharacterized protein n=1 Tax=Larkinella rosea TaxID=2025312 RepID=A0A3P1C4F1_9BACT|nr:hypothetical protein [Larkinella rosea]RRB07754.1 hypothetical protein EHT25_08265 [Larkinella rosea]
MNAATKKLLKLTIKSPTGAKAVFAPSIETASLFTSSGLLVNKKALLAELEVYFQGSVLNKKIIPFPKLKPGNDLYFLLNSAQDKLVFRGNVTPKSNQVGFVELIRETNEVNKVYTWAFVEAINVRPCKTTFTKEDNQFLGSYEGVIKRADGTEIFRQNLTTVLSGSQKKALNLSFDFSSFPSGVYEFTLADSNLWSERFLVDKTGEYKTRSTIVIRIPYSNVLQGYTESFELEDGTLKEDEFITCTIEFK